MGGKARKGGKARARQRQQAARHRAAGAAAAPGNGAAGNGSSEVSAGNGSSELSAGNGSRANGSGNGAGGRTATAASPAARTVAAKTGAAKTAAARTPAARTPAAAAADAPTDAEGPSSARTAYDRRWWTLVVLCLSLVIIILGNTVLNVALPTLTRQLKASSTELQWMVDAYALVFAGLLLFAGALGDRFGRKGALTTGLVIFGAGSGVAALSHSAGQLVADRAVMGLGAALVMPATLSILTNVFPPEERARAIAIWAGLAAAGAAIGPVSSGFLLEHFWWGSVFLLNLPVVVIALVAGRFLVPPSRDPNRTPLDPVGAVLSVVGLGALLYAIIEAPTNGWADPLTLGAFALAAVVLSGFAFWELHSTHPMLDLRYFRIRRFSAASGAIVLVFFALFGSFFLLTQYFQLVLGYATLQAGVRVLPAALTIMVAAPLSAKLVERFGPKRVVATGLTLVAAGLALMSTAGVGSPYLLVAASLVVLASGMGLTMAPATTSIMSSMPLGKAGVGSAVNDTTRELGGALGVAVLGSLLASTYTSSLHGAVARLPKGLAAQANSSLGGALQAAGRLGGPAGAALARAARQAFVDGMSTSLLVGSAVCVVAAALVARFMPAVAVLGEAAASHGAPVRTPAGAGDGAGRAPVVDLEPAGAAQAAGANPALGAAGTPPPPDGTAPGAAEPALDR